MLLTKVREKERDKRAGNKKEAQVETLRRNVG
jgi:hypothetical protein